MVRNDHLTQGEVEVWIEAIDALTETLRLRGVNEKVYMTEELDSRVMIGTGPAKVQIALDEDGDLVMHEYKALATAESDYENAVAVDAIRDIFRQAGSCLSLSIMSGVLPAGHATENVAIQACDDAWSSLADKIIEFALED